jgi:hypothetical protein
MRINMRTTAAIAYKVVEPNNFAAAPSRHLRAQMRVMNQTIGESMRVPGTLTYMRSNGFEVLAEMYQ